MFRLLCSGYSGGGGAPKKTRIGLWGAFYIKNYDKELPKIFLGSISAPILGLQALGQG